MLSITDTFSVERRANSPVSGARTRIGLIPRLFMKLAALVALVAPLMAQTQAGEANLKLPDLGSVTFISARSAADTTSPSQPTTKRCLWRYWLAAETCHGSRGAATGALGRMPGWDGTGGGG